MTFLEKVIEEKKRVVAALKAETPLEYLMEKAGQTEKRPFCQVFSRRYSNEVKIMAEVKRVSPSRGTLIKERDITGLTGDYERGGASAISIVTEERYFNGSLDDIAQAKKAVALPVLRKDFIVDEYEIFQTKAAGADGILLIGEALEADRIAEFLEISRQTDIDVLLEIHSMRTYEKIAGLKGFILGINNRNLETLEVDLQVSRHILKNIPDTMLVIVESGIEERRHMEGFMEYGVSGFLIGTSLITSPDPSGKLRELRGES